MQRILSIACAVTLAAALCTSAQAQTYPEQQQQPTQQQPTTPPPAEQPTTPPPAEQPAPTTTETPMVESDLPATASMLPLMGLAGLIALGAGVALSRRRKA